jgi:hypothetical protein
MRNRRIHPQDLSPHPPRARRAMHPLPSATSNGSAQSCAPRATGRAALSNRSSLPSSKRDLQALTLSRGCQAGRAAVCPQTSEATIRRPKRIRPSENFSLGRNSLISLVTY